jgi:SAM-dependent methyltransferase
MQVLTQVEGRYALSSSAAKFLVCSRPSYAGDLILAWTGPEIWTGLARAVRRGKPSPFEEYHDQDAWLESYGDWRLANSLELWEAAGIHPQPDAPRRLLDVACGCAIKSLALARRDPALHVTGIDVGHVLPAARDLAARMGLSGQATFVEADLLTVALGAGSYDIALLGQITHYLTPEQNQDLFRRLHTALRPGGTLVLDVPMPSEQPSEWTQIVSLLLWANGGGGTHTFEAYCTWLADAGFAQVTRSSDRWAIAVKPGEPAWRYATTGKSPARGRRSTTESSSPR